jgi:uncharacterized membrane protein YidH (DUF202 family)
MILFPIVLLALYAAMHARSTVKGMRIKDDTPESADATTRLFIIVVGAIVLLAVMTGGL